MNLLLRFRWQLVALVLLASLAQPGLAVRRRGAKLYPDKETTADMSGVNRIFIGWVDMKEDDWAAHGYSDKAEWTAAINQLNSELLRLARLKFAGKTVEAAKQAGDENAAGYDLYIKLSDINVDYSKYHLHMSMRFIDPKTNAELGSLPARPYFGNDWGLVRYLKASLDEASDKMKVEVLGNEEKKKRKIPLVGKKSE
jgi:hypothetical protein